MLKDITLDEIYNDIYDDIRDITGKPIGEILIRFNDTLHAFDSHTWKKLDSSNILNKTDYPDLYKKIGDKYSNFYKLYAQDPSNNYSFPTSFNPDTQFMVPDLTGRYLVQRNDDEDFILTNESIQAFKITIPGNFAKLQNFSYSYNDFKNTEESNLALQEVKKPIKEIKFFMDLDSKNTGDTIDIDSRNCIFYIRCK